MSSIEDIEIKITVECEGEYKSGTKDRYDSAHGNYLPGDPPEVDNFKVFLSRVIVDQRRVERVDITSFIDNDQLEDLKSEYMQIIEGGE